MTLCRGSYFVDITLHVAGGMPFDPYDHIEIDLDIALDKDSRVCVMADGQKLEGVRSLEIRCEPEMIDVTSIFGDTTRQYRPSMVIGDLEDLTITKQRKEWGR